MLLSLILVSSWWCVDFAAGQHPAEPCALAAAALEGHPTDQQKIDAQVAYDCLRSIPIHKQNASALVSSLIPYVNWQSSLSYLKDPPAGYEHKPVDILGSLSDMIVNITAGNYESEYDYQVDLFNLFNSAKDGHCIYLPDILGQVVFERDVILVSVSIDGVELPKVYTFDDIKASLANTTFKPSAISKINGQDAPTFLENESELSSETGRDAGYNAMFRPVSQNYYPQIEVHNGYFAGDDYSWYNYPGAKTTLIWENGTQASVDTLVRVDRELLKGVIDGESLYQKIVLPELSASATASEINTTRAPVSTSTNATAEPSRAYPEPVVISSDFQVRGYYLSGTHNDTGVLSLSSFMPRNECAADDAGCSAKHRELIGIAEYQATIQSFLASMKKDGKTRIVIDLSSNPGGVIMLAHDAFRQFFPQTAEMDYSRFREHPGFNQMVEQANALLTSFDANASTDADLLQLYGSAWNYRLNINATRQPFTSEQAQMEPQIINGDKFSNIAQLDYNNARYTLNDPSGIGIDITGYKTRANFTQPFPAENIVLLYDGLCGSACASFGLNMEFLGKVKSVAMGGRPNMNYMQGIGGTRGGWINSFDNIRKRAQTILKLSSPAVAANLTELKAYSTLPIDRSTAAVLNVQDTILPDHLADGVPSQFLNIPSDCRLFYTPQTVTNLTKMWESVAASAWKGQACNVGAVNNGDAERTEAATYAP